jgi:hypothetical protein
MTIICSECGGVTAGALPAGCQHCGCPFDIVTPTADPLADATARAAGAEARLAALVAAVREMLDDCPGCRSMRCEPGRCPQCLWLRDALAAAESQPEATNADAV